jgi:hypothetical protein
MLWALDRDELPVKVEAVSVQTGERMEAVPSHASVIDTTSEVARAIDDLRAGWETGESLERTAGPWCRWCPLLDECSEGRAATDLLGS